MPVEMIETAFDTVLGLVGGNPLTILGLAGLGLLIYWWLDERRSSGSAADTIEGVGNRADDLFGNTVGAFGSLVTVVLTIAVTIGNELLMAGSAVNSVVEAPALIGHVIIGLVGWAGFRGLIPVNATGYGWAFVILTLLVLWARFSGGESTA